MSEQNINVFPKQHSAGSATEQFIEFEVTRNAHMSERAKCPYTVTVMFKDPPRHLVSHAWRILRHVCYGRELYPDKVTEWMNDALKNHTGQEQEAVHEEEVDCKTAAVLIVPLEAPQDKRRKKRRGRDDATNSISEAAADAEPIFSKDTVV